MFQRLDTLLAVRRLPIKVRLNRSFFPVDLISVRTRGGRSLDGVCLTTATTDDIYKAHAGDGTDPMSLGPTGSIDTFILENQYRPEALALGRVGFVRVQRGAPRVLHITWERVDGEDNPGEVCIIWSYEDRKAGLAPVITVGNPSGAAARYIQSRHQPVSAALLGPHSRVKEMTRRDIRQRYKDEQKGLKASMNGSPPRVRSISIEGFRGFREEAVLQLAQPTGAHGSGLTFVVGANNSGKSTIWESFDAVARKLKNNVSFAEGRRNRAAQRGVRLRLDLENDSSYTVASISGNTSETTATWSGGEPAELEIVSVPSRRQFQPQFGRGGSAERDWMMLTTDFTRFRQNHEFTNRLFRLHNDADEKAKFDDLMAKVLGYSLIWTIDLGEGDHGSSYYLKVTTETTGVSGRDNVSHTSEGLGDGIISLLFLLNALYDSEPHTLVVIDEPELSLHPELIRRLGGVFADFARDRQIVVFTHSPQLVSWDCIENGAEIARVYKFGADSRIAQATRSTIRNVSALRGDWANPHTLGLDAAEILFLGDGVILVEGQQDAALLPRAFEQAGVHVPGKIYGWGSAGASNVVRIAALLKELGFLRVVALLDNNVSAIANRIRRDHPEYYVTAIPADDIHDKDGKVGLLDPTGSTLKPHLREPLVEVLSGAIRYLTSDPSSPQP